MLGVAAGVCRSSSAHAASRTGTPGFKHFQNLDKRDVRDMHTQLSFYIRQVSCFMPVKVAVDEQLHFAPVSPQSDGASTIPASGSLILRTHILKLISNFNALFSKRLMFCEFYNVNLDEVRLISVQACTRSSAEYAEPPAQRQH